MISRDEFIELLRSKNSSAKIYQDYLLSSEVWLLRETFGQDCFVKYDELKNIISNKLQISSSQVCLVGGAKVGFSMNPFKDFSAFDSEKSDLDIVIVCPSLFNKFWELLLKNYYSKTNFVDKIHLENVFRKFVNISEKNSNGLSQAFGKLNSHFGEIQRDVFVKLTISNTLNYRIYQTWDAVNKYHIKGIDDLRKKV